MADYIPVFKPGEDLTMTAGADIVGGRLVVVSAANTVVEASAASEKWLGVATMDAKSGQKVGVTSGGVQEVTAGGAIAVGVNVMAAASGKVVTIGAGTAFQVVGIALTVANADGDKIRVRFVR